MTSSDGPVNLSGGPAVPRTVDGPLFVQFRSSGLELAGDRWQVGPGSTCHGTVLLLHGGGQRRQSWHTTGERLARCGWNALAMDARGHGDSAWSPTGDYSSDALIDDVAEIVGQIGGPVILVGASMGGMTALLGEGERGHMARGLVLVDIAPKVEQGGVRRIQEFMTAAPNGYGSLDEVADAIQAYSGHRRRPSSTEGILRNVRLGADERWHWHWDPALLGAGDEPSRGIDHERARRAAARITVPTLLVRGAESDIVSDDGVAELLELIPHARYNVVDSTGHMVAGDDNDSFTGNLVEFLNSEILGLTSEDRASPR